MRQVNRTLARTAARYLAALALVAGGAVAGAGIVAARGPGAVNLADDKHPHMHAAREALANARKRLSESDKYDGHRDRAIEYVDKAITEIDDGLGERKREDKR